MTRRERLDQKYLNRIRRDRSGPKLRSRVFAWSPDHKPLSPEQYMRTFLDDARVVAATRIGDVLISTVYLAIDHGYGCSQRPLIFETMVFKGESRLPLEIDGRSFTRRYSYRREARLGHKQVAREVASILKSP